MRMRQLTIILAALMVASNETEAGILDWLRGSPVDPVASFQRGVARLREHQNQVFGDGVGVTPELIEPVVAKVTIVENHSVFFVRYNLRLVFSNNSWVIGSFTSTMAYFDGSVVGAGALKDVPETPDSPMWKAIQACFVSDKAAAAAATEAEAARAATRSPPPESDRRAKPADEAAAAVPSTLASAPTNSEVDQSRSAASRALENAIRAVEKRDYLKAASYFDELSRLATDSDLKSKAPSVSSALHRLAETGSEADAQEVLATIKAFRSSVEPIVTASDVTCSSFSKIHSETHGSTTLRDL